MISKKSLDYRLTELEVEVEILKEQLAKKAKKTSKKVGTKNVVKVSK